MIYVTGDMHGDIDRFLSADFKKLKSKDTLIVTGDFGFIWDGSKRERKILKYLGSRKYNVCFIDGPHDNFPRIYSHRNTIWKGGQVHRISGHLFHMCRGQVFHIEGCSIFTFGGGESVDKDMRSGEYWFRQEMPTKRQMAQGADNLDEIGAEVDFIITHEPPAAVKRAMQLRNGVTIYANKLNGYLEEISDGVKFRQWYFGAFHEDKRITPKHTAVFNELIPINADLKLNYTADDDEYYDEMDEDLPESALDGLNDDEIEIIDERPALVHRSIDEMKELFCEDFE